MRSYLKAIISLPCLLLFISSSQSESPIDHYSWTPWINHRQPIAHVRRNLRGDETEHVTPDELINLCPMGDVKAIECAPHVTVGNVVQRVSCDVTSGLRCMSADNLPGGCHDYKIRLYCIRKLLDNLSLRMRRAASGMTANCNTWSGWVNDNHPSGTITRDSESVQRAALDTFCPPLVGGNLDKLECQDNNGEPLTADTNLTSVGFFVHCSDAYTGVLCEPWKQNVKCADFSFRYHCYCPSAATNPPDTLAVSSTAIVAMSTGPTVPYPTSVPDIATNGVGQGAGTLKTLSNMSGSGLSKETANQLSQDSDDVSKKLSLGDKGCNLLVLVIGLGVCALLLLINVFITASLCRKINQGLKQAPARNSKVANLANV